MSIDTYLLPLNVIEPRRRIVFGERSWVLHVIVSKHCRGVCVRCVWWRRRVRRR